VQKCDEVSLELLARYEKKARNVTDKTLLS